MNVLNGLVLPEELCRLPATRMQTSRSVADLTRRTFLRSALVLAGASAVVPVEVLQGRTVRVPLFQTRGIVLIPEDLSWTEWPDRAAHAGLNTIALHHGRSVFEVIKFIHSEPGRRFLARCHRLRLEVEYELHAITDLLPRWHYDEDKSLFRMDDHGERVRDCNLCVHSPRALQIVAENALAVARLLPPTTQRFFFWGDDGMPWCRCPECREFSESEQALLFENHLIKSLRTVYPRAQLAHLAYANTISAPKKVRPDPGIFLEYAPIRRRYDRPYASQNGGADALANLDENLKVFPAETAQVLEYWLDVSRFSNWKRPAIRLPWNGDVFLADLEACSSRGIRRVTSFACYIDSDYIKSYGAPSCLAEYGAGLMQSVKTPRRSSAN